MKKVVEKVFIGKNVARTASLAYYGSGANLVEGEIAILDKTRML